MSISQGFCEGQDLPAIYRFITQDIINQYAEASGDFNPIHVDSKFASESQFGSTIAHGMLVASGVSELMATTFPKEWQNAGRMKLRFRAPVFPGDKITTTGRIRQIRKKCSAVEIVCTVAITKVNGEEAVSGEASVFIPSM